MTSEVTHSEAPAISYGDDEVGRFFAGEIVDDEVTPIVTPAANSIATTTAPSPGESSIFLSQCSATYNSTEKILKNVIVQRDLAKFWGVLLLQNFDLKRHILNIRFAGEAAADVGGPYREFLTSCMKNFHLLNVETFGSANGL